MLEYVLESPLVIKQKEAEMPEPKGYDVLVRVHYVGICGSDIHLYTGSYNGPHSYPMLLGHEWSGVVEEIGEKVTKVSVGDKVTGDCSKYCGTCTNCKNDKNLCSNIEKYGITVNGASAEYIIRNEKYLYKAPKRMDEKLLCLSEPIAVAHHLLEKIKRVLNGDFTDKHVLVLGGGVIGMSAAMILMRMERCANVELFDLADTRNNLAKSVGAKVPEAGELQPKAGTDYASIYESSKYDVVIETTGVGKVFANALTLVKPDGVLGCVGMIANVEIPQKLIVTKALTVVGSIGGTGNFDRAMDFIYEYPEIAKKLISHCYPITDYEHAFATAKTPKNSMKVVLSI